MPTERLHRDDVASVAEHDRRHTDDGIGEKPDPPRPDSVPELPVQKRVRFASEDGLDEKAADALVGDITLANYFEEAVSEFREEIPDGSIAAVYN